MKSRRMMKICAAVCLVLGLAFGMRPLTVQAAEIIATVEGTVKDKTTSELIYLDTAQGEMQIKLDKDTDTSECKILLPNTKIRVALSYGSDAYLHAVKLYRGAADINVNVDKSATATVTGTLSEKTKDNLLYLNTPQGEMQIKLDSSTDMSGCKVLVAKQTYTIVCARGSDAVMHAVSISGGALAAPSGSWLTPAPADPNNAVAPTMTIAGKIRKDTKESLLLLSTNDGNMQFLIDSNTDTRQGMVLTPDNQVAVAYYRSSDGALHATMIVGVKASISTVTVNQSSAVTVTGTVGKKSNEELLYLDTPQGEMQLKLDAVKKVSGCKALTEGRKLDVSCAGGSDAFMHALEISAY